MRADMMIVFHLTANDSTVAFCSEELSLDHRFQFVESIANLLTFCQRVIGSMHEFLNGVAASVEFV